MKNKLENISGLWRFCAPFKHGHLVGAAIFGFFGNHIEGTICYHEISEDYPPLFVMFEFGGTLDMMPFEFFTPLLYGDCKNTDECYDFRDANEGTHHAPLGFGCVYEADYDCIEGMIEYGEERHMAYATMHRVKNLG